MSRALSRLWQVVELQALRLRIVLFRWQVRAELCRRNGELTWRLIGLVALALLGCGAVVHFLTYGGW